MTIEEAIKEKKTLDNRIGQLISEFYMSTGLTVTGISIDYRSVLDCNCKAQSVYYKIETAVML